MKGFRNGDFGVLVATNVAARGLDIPEVDLVVQSSPPKVSVLYYNFTVFWGTKTKRRLYHLLSCGE